VAARKSITRSETLSYGSIPSAKKDLPPALQVDEIQVRQMVLEHEREPQKSIEMNQ
jgi:hypothetical protein